MHEPEPEDETVRTERLILEALEAGGDWMDQKQIRRVTGLPVTRVQNFTLSMALHGTIQRRLVDNDHVQQFKAGEGVRLLP